jgi:hypothetical protein
LLKIQAKTFNPAFVVVFSINSFINTWLIKIMPVGADSKLTTRTD